MLVLDRSPLLRRGVAEVLREDPELHLVADTDDLERAVELIATVEVGVVLVDLDLAAGGIEACRRLRQVAPKVPVVVLAAGSEDDVDLPGSVRAGARGYLRRDCAPAALTSALRAAAAGLPLLSPALTARLLDEFAGLAERAAGPPDGTASLSPRETEVLTLVSQGLSNRDIAERLFISPSTVKNHVRSIHDKLGVHSRTAAVVTASRSGMLTLK
ncbi:MAG TPA: response regulator transcription factor [Candidatus Nanopelagicales bacterium]|nr:response regulator transcription factor [Candidatus Nanopelagicales bacterium]